MADGSVMSPKVLVIEGAIAAGKSTLVEHLVNTLRDNGYVVAVAPEPVDNWEEVGILDAFYKDPKGMAYTFQTYACMTRINRMRAAYEEASLLNGRVDYVVCERSPLTDRFVFMELQAEMCGPMFMKMYLTWWNEWMRLVPKDISEAMETGNWYEVWLQPSIAHCMSRLHERARTCELQASAEVSASNSEVGSTGVDETYQQRLHDAHEEFLLGENSPFPKNCVVRVSEEDANQNFRDDEEARRRIIQQITQAVS